MGNANGGWQIRGVLTIAYPVLVIYLHSKKNLLNTTFFASGSMYIFRRTLSGCDLRERFYIV